MVFVFTVMVLVGESVLIFSVVPAGRIISILPRGRTRSLYQILRGLTIFLGAGYLVYAVSFTGEADGPADLLVPLLFLLGGCGILAWELAHLRALRRSESPVPVPSSPYDAMTDRLMGIYDRSYADVRLPEEVARALRYGLPFSVALLEMDGLDEIGESLGAEVVDTVLCRMGKVLRSMLRRTDIAARYQKGRVLMLLTNTGVSGASAAVGRIRQTVEAFEFVDAGSNPSGEPVRCTVSIGIATLGDGPTGAATSDSEVAEARALLGAATNALSDAMRAGGNRIVEHGYVTCAANGESIPPDAELVTGS